MSFPHYKQQDQMDCGATCLRIVAKYYGRNINIYRLRKLCQVTKNGVNMLGVSEAAEKLGFRTLGLRVSVEQLEVIQLPYIIQWRQNHFLLFEEILLGEKLSSSHKNQYSK